MGGAIGHIVAIAVLMVRGGKQLAGLDKHFADMFVAMHTCGNDREMVEIKDIHGVYLSTISTGHYT